MTSRTSRTCSNGFDDTAARAPVCTTLRGNRSVVSVPLVVESAVTTTDEQPVTVGIPFPLGVLTDVRALALSDASGHFVRLQTAPLARWPDGSVKWLLLDFICRPLVKGQETWCLKLDHENTQELPEAEQPLHVEETGRAMIVKAGSASFTLEREVLAPIVQIEIDGVPILDAADSQTVLIDAKGRSRRPRIERSEIEVRGPVRATVLFEGSFEGRHRDRCRFRARLSFFAGASWVHVELTIHNPRRARHRGGLWDLGDPGSIYFRDLSMRLGLVDSVPRHVRWIEDVDGPVRAIETVAFEIYQDSSGGENWQSRNHVNRFGKVPCRFRGYRVRHGGDESFGLRASPIVSIRGHAGTVTAAIPEFWQQFPKAIDTDVRTLNLRLFPRQFGDLFELQGGEQKTHEVWLDFSRVERSGIDRLGWVHRPARVRCTPEWYAGTGVISHLIPASDNPGDRYESYLTDVVHGQGSLFARREVIDEYGWRNFGDVYADHEAAFYDGKSPVISHYNNQYDVILGLLIQHLRTGIRSWFDLADSLSRHVIDIDIYHTEEDKAAYNGGLFWHTDHYRDAAASTHRTYSRVNAGPVKSAYGGGPCNEHNYTTGLLYYYYLTGNPLARDAVLGLADWVIRMDDGSRSILGLIDDGPTGYSSSTIRGHYHGPGRGSGNSINALLDAWVLTESRDYLDKAEDLVRRAVHPAINIAALDLLNVELRWSYTVFLSVLARYLGLKAEVREVDTMYAYARDTLLIFGSWMLENEVPYFDHPEKLEFPTETWAAQEFRKANVLRFTAQFADAPLRKRLIDRARELAERAWSDLAVRIATRSPGRGAHVG